MNQSNLPLEADRSLGDGMHQPPQSSLDASADASQRIGRSFLWAAYGDALGWISELTDNRGLRRRTGGVPLERPIPWSRKVGGRSGVQAALPRGCYSDDSQLRLATARSIRASGFDVEAFAKVELPVWVSYGLGAGRSTTAAAVNLSNRRAVWWANQFKNWTNSGGNGAAMRVQPHVWAAPPPRHSKTYLMDVVRNAICTHSHPIGLIGAVLHARCLAHVMSSGQLPLAADLEVFLKQASDLPNQIKEDGELRNWLVAFETAASPFVPAWKKAVDETCRALDHADHICANSMNDAPETRYARLLDALGLRSPEIRGSGMLTALAAVGLTWIEARPSEAMRVAANALGSDTDTIATMAGALLGSMVDEDPQVEVLDAALFRDEAKRLARLARGETTSAHQYPDLLHWSPPKSRSDVLSRCRDGGLYVQGLGPAKELDKPTLSAGQFMWQWVKLEFGQTLLIKRRHELPEFKDDESIKTESTSRRSKAKPSGRSSLYGAPTNEEETVLSPNNESDWRRDYAERTENVLKTVDYLLPRVGNDATIGRVLKKVAQNGTPAEFAGVISALYDLLRQDPSMERDVALGNPPTPTAQADARAPSEGSRTVAPIVYSK